MPEARVESSLASAFFVLPKHPTPIRFQNVQPWPTIIMPLLSPPTLTSMIMLHYLAVVLQGKQKLSPRHIYIFRVLCVGSSFSDLPLRVPVQDRPLPKKYDAATVHAA